MELKSIVQEEDEMNTPAAKHVAGRICVFILQGQTQIGKLHESEKEDSNVKCSEEPKQPTE